MSLTAASWLLARGVQVWVGVECDVGTATPALPHAMRPEMMAARVVAPEAVHANAVGCQAALASRRRANTRINGDRNTRRLVGTIRHSI